MRSWYRGCCRRACSLWRCGASRAVIQVIESESEAFLQTNQKHRARFGVGPTGHLSTTYAYTREKDVATACARGDGKHSSFPARYLAAHPPIAALPQTLARGRREKGDRRTGGPGGGFVLCALFCRRGVVRRCVVLPAPHTLDGLRASA